MRQVYIFFLLLLFAGCRGEFELERAPGANGGSESSLLQGSSGPNSGRDAVMHPVAARNQLPFAGVFVPSGWMGDAADPTSGPLRRRLCREDARIASSFETWTYSPSDSNSDHGYVAVAYQHPDSNFGNLPGIDLSGKGYTRVSFRAKSASRSPARVVFKSGGHTAPGSIYPASYEVELGQVELRDSWTRFSVSIAGEDHSSISAGLVFVLLADDGPCEFSIRDLAFEGP